MSDDMRDMMMHPDDWRYIGYPGQASKDEYFYTIDAFRDKQLNQNLSYAARDAAAGPTRLTGEFLLMGAGEKRVPVDFPVSFSEKPLLTFGAELQEGAAVVDGKFPTVSVVVARWFTFERPPFSRLFSGAELMVVTTGSPTQQLIIHWHLDGVALTNPI
ncbi:MAG: hypothetical protein EBU08_00300 [Micrococcales bacterium]|nr:hypothetical protein [Micrococcales bacterium]